MAHSVVKYSNYTEATDSSTELSDARLKTYA